MAKTTIKTNTNAAADNGEFRDLNIGDLKFYKPGEMSKGDTFTGTYLETKVMGQYESPVHIFERKIEDGTIERYAINNTGQLAFYMKQVTPGSIVRLTYDGQQKLAKGKFAGKPAHNFKVAVSSTSPRPVAAVPKEETGEVDSDDFDDSSL